MTDKFEKDVESVQDGEQAAETSEHIANEMEKTTEKWEFISDITNKLDETKKEIDMTVNSKEGITDPEKLKKQINTILALIEKHIDAWTQDKENRELYDSLIINLNTSSKIINTLSELEWVESEHKIKWEALDRKFNEARKNEVIPSRKDALAYDDKVYEGHESPIKWMSSVDAHFESLWLDVDQREAIQWVVVWYIGTAAWPTTLQSISQTWQPHGGEYAHRYAELHHNHMHGIAYESESEYMKELAEILGESSDEIFGSNRDLKKTLWKLNKLRRKMKGKKKKAQKILKCATEIFFADMSMKRSMRMADHMLSRWVEWTLNHHAIPTHQQSDIRATAEWKYIITFAKENFGDSWREEIASIVADKKFAHRLSLPHGGMQTFVPTQGIQSNVSSSDTRDDKTSTTLTPDGRADHMPGNMTQALSWYLHKYNEVNLTGEKPNVYDTWRSLYMIERWMSPTGWSYNILWAITQTKNPATNVLYTEAEARTIMQQILKDGLASKPAWRGRIRSKYLELASNYRSNKEKRERKPGKYTGYKMEDIPEEDMHDLRSLAVVDGTCQIFCGSANSDLVRDRLSSVYEDGTAAWNPHSSYSESLTNDIVGMNIFRIMNEIDGKWTGDAKDRYINSVYNNGYFVWLPGAAETMMNNFAKDVLNMDESAAYKLGKIGKWAAAVWMVVAGWKLLKRVWKWGKEWSPSFLSRLWRLGMLWWVWYFLWSEFGALIKGGEIGKSWAGKRLAWLFGAETNIEWSEWFTPALTLSYIFGDMSTKNALSMFSYNNKSGTFVLDDKALKKIKTIHPGMSPDQLATIESMLNEPKSQLNQHLNLWLKTHGITNQATYDDTLATYGSVLFGEFMQTYTIASNVAKEVRDLWIDIPADQIKDLEKSLANASEEERTLIIERLKNIDAYGEYYNTMTAKLDHIFTHRKDMLDASWLSEDDITKIKAWLANKDGMKAIVMGYALSKDGFSKTSTVEDLTTKLAQDLYGGQIDMLWSWTESWILNYKDGYTQLEKLFNEETVDPLIQDYLTNKNRYVNRPTTWAEVYTEKMLSIDNQQIFLSISSKWEAAPWMPATTLSMRVPTDAWREEWKVMKYNAKPLHIKSLWWKADADGNTSFVMEQYNAPLADGSESPWYAENPWFNATVLKTMLTSATGSNTGATTFTIWATENGNLKPDLKGGTITMQKSWNKRP